MFWRDELSAQKYSLTTAAVSISTHLHADGMKQICNGDRILYVD